MTIQIASSVGPARIDIAYERLGPADGIPVILIMGLGAQLIRWPDGFCDMLVARGLHLVRFDNRDVGESTHFKDAPMPNVAAALAGDASSAAYTLSDMAADTVGLLDALGLATAHFVGASLGGYIAQTIAIEHPKRLRSLTSMMATTGARAVGQPSPGAMRALMGSQPTTRDEVIEKTVAAARAIGSPGFEINFAEIAKKAGESYDRSYDPLGMARQGIASIASGDRTARLHDVKAPALVIHGANDPVCNVSGGRATAEAIPGAKLVIIDGMGHDLPRAVWPQITTAIADHIHAAEPRIQ